MPNQQLFDGIIDAALFDWVEGKVEIFLEEREVAFLSPSKIFTNFSGW